MEASSRASVGASLEAGQSLWEYGALAAYQPNRDQRRRRHQCALLVSGGAPWRYLCAYLDYISSHSFTHLHRPRPMEEDRAPPGRVVVAAPAAPRLPCWTPRQAAPGSAASAMAASGSAASGLEAMPLATSRWSPPPPTPACHHLAPHRPQQGPHSSSSQ